MERAVANFTSDWQGQYEIIEAREVTTDRAMLLTRQYPLRGYDAVHLTAALTAADIYQRRAGTRLTFVSADRNLLQAATSEGMLVDDPNTHP
jgi:hypothetical protein